MRLIAAGHHVRGVRSLFPWRVIGVLSHSSFQLNVNGARAKADV